MFLKYGLLQVIGEDRGPDHQPVVEQCVTDKFAVELTHELDYFKKASRIKVLHNSLISSQTETTDI